MIFRLIIVLVLFCDTALAQFSIPAYTIRKDSATHITVVHSGNSEKTRMAEHIDSPAIVYISPDIRLLNGVVEHQGLTGEIWVREYYVDSLLIGYIEFDGRDIIHELYYNAAGNIFLEKYYDKGSLLSLNNSIQKRKRNQ